MKRFAVGRSLLGALMLVGVPAHALHALHALQSDSILKVQLNNGMYPTADARAIPRQPCRCRVPRASDRWAGTESERCGCTQY